MVVCVFFLRIGDNLFGIELSELNIFFHIVSGCLFFLCIFEFNEALIFFFLFSICFPPLEIGPGSW